MKKFYLLTALLLAAGPFTQVVEELSERILIYGRVLCRCVGEHERRRIEESTFRGIGQQVAVSVAETCIQLAPFAVLSLGSPQCHRE